MDYIEPDHQSIDSIYVLNSGGFDGFGGFGTAEHVATSQPVKSVT